jgi:hypothetical protein
MMNQQAAKQRFDEATVAAILRANAQCERGEGIDFADAAASLRQRAASL